MAPPNADPPEPAPGDHRDDDDLDVDVRFAEIVRDFGESSSDTTAGTTRGSDAFPAAPWVAAGPRDWPTTPEVEELEDAETNFTPPDPPLVLGHDPLVTLAWGLVIGVPLILLVLVAFLRPFPTTVGQIGAAAFLAGLAVLIWRMPDRDPEDRDPGAVV